MMLHLGPLVIDARWAKSGEWTLTKPSEVEEDGIQYALWVWLGVVRNGRLTAAGLCLGPIKLLVGVKQ
ncbi:MAG: hypothetical protein EOM24_26850 [Chloroflexia bacterium]|nr:hypothetical protein [Chloroflexia bacterium]